MTTQFRRSGNAAEPAPQAPPGRSARAAAGRHSAAPGAELAAALRRGTGYGRCYDRFGSQLYRYCWSLLGPGGSGTEADRAAAAVHEAFSAAAESIDALGDDREFAAWLFALCRAAARRRGFAPRSPYAQLATADSEQAPVQLSLRLPPSYRELLELYLRHGLPTASIARILGLAPETAAELCRAAVLRAAELLTRHALAPGRTGERGVRSVLGGLEPPGPPPALRERVIEDCASPLAAPARRAAAEALAPLGEDGFPLHRKRAPGAHGRPSAPAPDSAPEPGRGDDETAALPADRVTTRDVPVRAAPEPVAASGAAEAGRPGRRRLPTAVVATLAAGAVFACLWAGVAAVRAQQGDTVTGAVPPAAPTAAPSPAQQNPSPVTGRGDLPEIAEPVPPERLEATVEAPPAPESGGSDPAEADGAPSAAPAPGEPDGQQPSAAPGDPGSGDQQEGASDDGGEASGESDDESGGASGAGSDSGSDDASGGGPLSDLFDGLFGFFTAGEGESA
ncbi:hypothetical protein FZ103_16440 [Streptomonospora sp. PA3]|uniref:hypothetical protein n=1 Tax=Streptomonospora sp. PA3 TaxID=2607326 RepID=UPI0012DF4996|nr:hypothetical protein [Streptomonospora sp. PA3]MUL42739.1 hypothetical protein [Streptomonospora sp. PA3]